MKTNAKKILGGLLAVLSAVPAGAFDEFPIGARPSALSGAFTALADDAHSLYYNPAGLATLNAPQATAYYARLFPDLTDQTQSALTFLAGAGPLPLDGRWGGVGLAYSEFHMDSLYKERELRLGYGRSFLANRLALGLNLKSLEREFGSTPDTLNAFSGNNPSLRTGGIDPIFLGGNSAKAWGVDLGALYRFHPRWRGGLSLLNANQPDVGLVNSQKLPMVTRLGVAYEPKLMKVSLDLTHRSLLTSGADTRFLFGAERAWLFRRYGVVTLRGGAGFGGRDFRQGTLGAGYELNGVSVDYVFTIPLGAHDVLGNSHNFALSYRFGHAPAEEELLALIVQEKEATARAEEALRLAEAESLHMKEERDRVLQENNVALEKMKQDLENARKYGGAPPRELTPEEREKLARNKALREFAAAFDAAYRAYTAEGGTLTRRVERLKEILEKYKDKGISLTKAERELERVKTELAQVSNDYRLTMDFFRKNAAQGADPQEQISLLERLIKKYTRSGIDLSEAKNALEKLKGGQ